MKKEINVINDCTGMFNEDIIETILQSRGVKDTEHFLNPTADDILPLDSLYRVDEAANTIIDGIVNGKKFFINVDSDTDGVCSGVQAIRYLRSVNCDVDWHVSQGKTHGTSEELIEKLEGSKPDILIIVDSLDADVENYKLIHDMGIKIIILDHHEISPDLESEYDKYSILVSSNRRYDNSQLSGAGVVWKTLLYIDNMIGTLISYSLVDLAACGIVADMMDMSESSMENRAIVNMALSNLENPAMKKLIGNFEFNSNSFSYNVAPLINASCRYNENESAVNAFLSDNNKDVLKYLKVLKNCKDKQNEEVSSLMPDLIEQANNQSNNKMIVVVIDTNSGISGLLGNNLVQLYQRPVMVLKENYGGYSGSCRSIGCGDFRQICEDTGLAEVAGHSEAFGVININFNDFLLFRERIEEELNDIDLKTEIDVDIELSVGEINENLINQIKKLDRISGKGFKPISVLTKCDNYEPTTMSKGRHLVLDVGYFGSFKFIKWNAGNRLEEFEDHQLCGDELTFIGTLDCGFLGRQFSNRMIVDEIIED